MIRGRQEGRPARDAAGGRRHRGAETGSYRRANSSKFVTVTGIVLAKMDSTARGGIVVALREELGIPVRLVGVGESLTDLEPFDPDDFVQGVLAAP